MSGAARRAFFALHDDLPREGPGEAADIIWAVREARTLPGADVWDAGCGPGGDIGTLLQAIPGARVTASDMHPPFVDAARRKWGWNRQVSVIWGSFLDQEAGPLRGERAGPFDLIWCAGAIYFVGVVTALESWRSVVSDEGAVAFSEPCRFVDKPGAKAQEMWAEYPQMRDAEGIDDWVRKAGWRTIATRKVSDAGWEAYYKPMERRIERLRPGADTDLTQALDEAEREIGLWRASKDEAGYLLSVVKPV